MSRKLERVLLVDDDPDILEVTQMCLEIAGGLKVTCCPGGKEALAIVEDVKPDFILLDIMMPDFDGPATFAALRKMSSLDAVPIAFMTARAQLHEIEEYLALGVAAVISKPFESMKLAGNIAEIWERFHAGRQ